MKGKPVIAALLFMAALLVFPSCSDAGLDELYQNGEYENLLVICNENLTSKIDEDSVYYKMMCHYHLGQYDEAGRAALIYLSMYEEDGRHINSALRILLYFSDDNEIRLNAGSRLCSSDDVRTNDLVSYYSVLMAEGYTEEAGSIYAQVRPALSARDASMMCIASCSDSTLIVSNLEAWHAASGYSSEYHNALLSAAGILLARREGQLILPQLIEAYISFNDMQTALIIGDVYAESGDSSRASAYYNYAYATYPDAALARLRALHLQS